MVDDRRGAEQRTVRPANTRSRRRPPRRAGIGNEDGKSETVFFEVNTQAPVVALLEGPPALSNDTTPSFSGEASEDGEVVVHVMEGSTEVGSAKATASGGTWSTTVSKPLAAGKHSYTAFATEKSGISGNPEGKSNTVSFEVNTLAPVVTIVQPPSPSNNRRPAFSGEASENTEVVVHVFEGADGSGDARKRRRPAGNGRRAARR